MTLTRLLAAPLLLFALSAFSQDSPKAIRNESFASGANSTSTRPPSEPGRIIPDETRNSHSQIKAPDWLGDSYVLQINPDGRSSILPKSDINLLPTERGERMSAEDDAICYSIRAYVVARDSKDSDATHPVRSSTCLPASKYRLKSAQERQETNTDGASRLH